MLMNTMEGDDGVSGLNKTRKGERGRIFKYTLCYDVMLVLSFRLSFSPSFCFSVRCQFSELRDRRDGMNERKNGCMDA